MPLVICDCQCTFGRDGHCELDKVPGLGLPPFCPYRLSHRPTGASYIGFLPERPV